jgi:hypothetical protein
MEVIVGGTGRLVFDGDVVFDQAPVELGANVLLGRSNSRDVDAGIVESIVGISVFGEGGWRTPH